MTEATALEPAQPYRILLIEDDSLTLEALLGIFKRAFPSYAVHTASTFAAVREALTRYSFSLLLIDPGLPDLGGGKEEMNRAEMIKFILSESPKSLHIVVTGRFSSKEADIVRKLGGKAYLGKFGLTSSILASIIDQMAETDFIQLSIPVSTQNLRSQVHYSDLTTMEESVIRFVETRPSGMKRTELFKLMARQFNLKNAESAEQKYKRARSKVIKLQRTNSNI